MEVVRLRGHIHSTLLPGRLQPLKQPALSLLDSLLRRVTRGNGIRAQADSRGYTGSCKKFTVPSEEKNALWKIEKAFVI